jgi:soluble lytic murein transglycosylase-like protein
MSFRAGRPAPYYVAGARTRARHFATALAAVAAFHGSVAHADCFDESARYHNVNPWILRAIAAQESGFNASAVARNTDGSIDRGMTGINSIHLPELARFGITAGDLLDSCKSIYLAGWHLRNMVNKFGNTWEAVGAYNSKTPSKRDVYKEKIRRIIDFWIAKGIMPQPM